MKILVFSTFVILNLTQSVFAGKSSAVSLGDDEVLIPNQYEKSRISKRVQENKACMLEFLETKVFKAGSTDDLFKTLKQSGYKFNIKVERYDPKENLVSDEDPKQIKRIEAKLKRYAKENGIEGEEVLDKLYYLLTDEHDEMNSYYLKLVDKGVVDFDEIQSFYNDRRVKIINKRRRKQKDKVTAKLDNNRTLNIKIPDIQNLWCKESYQKRIEEDLGRQIQRETSKDISATVVKRLKQVIKITSEGINPDCENCNVEEKLKQLRIKSFRGYTLNEQTGGIYDPSGDFVKNEILKKELYAYFYDRRNGLLSQDGTAQTDHIRPLTMLRYKVIYVGKGKSRQKCIIGTLQRDRQGKLVERKIKSTCSASPQAKLTFAEIRDDNITPKKEKCPIGLVLNTVTNRCEQSQYCPEATFYSFDKEKCIPYEKCEDGYLLIRHKNECIKAPVCKDTEEYNKDGQCVTKCNMGYIRSDGYNCEKLNLYKCPDRNKQYYDPYYEQCIEMPECAKDQYFNPETRHCEKQLCESQSQFSQYGICREMEKECGEGQVYNAYRNICEKERECPDMQRWQEAQRKCVKLLTNEDCKENQALDSINNKCVEIPKCTDGQILSYQYNECQDKAKCEQGYVYIRKGNRCQKILECAENQIFIAQLGFCADKR